MFIIKFEKIEERRAARNKLYKDEVFMYAHEEIMAINSPLYVEEIFCSADRLTDYLLKNEIYETAKLRFEIKDLKEEAEDVTTAYLIMTIAFHKLRALVRRRKYAAITWHGMKPLCEEWDHFKSLDHRIYNREIERKYYEKRGVDKSTYELLTIDEVNSLNAKEAIQKMLTKAADDPVEYLIWLVYNMYMLNDEYNGLLSEELEIAQTMIKKKSANNFSDKKIVVQNNENVTIIYHVAAPTGQAATAKKENRKAKKSDAKPVEKQHGVDYPVFAKGLGVTDAHLKMVYYLLKNRGWISPQTSESDFMMLFSDRSNDCKIKWTGQTLRGNNELNILGKSALYVLFKRLVEEKLIKTSYNERVGPILESHFIDEEGHFLTAISDKKTTSKQANEVIEQVINMMRVKPKSEDLMNLLAEEMQEKHDKYGFR